MAGLLSGIGNAVPAPAASAVVPALVPSGSPETLARANGLFQLGPAACIVVGPAVATPLVAWFGVEAVLLVDVVTFVIAIAVTLLTPFADAVDERPVADDEARGAPHSVGCGVRGARWSCCWWRWGAVNFLLSFFNVSMLAVSTDVGGAALAGVAVALGGVAMIGGSFAAGRVGVATRPVRVFAAALSVTAGGCGLAALRPWFLLVVVGVVVALTRVSLVNAGVATLFQTRVPVRSTIARSLDPIGVVIAGLVIAGLVIAEIAAPAMSDGGAGRRRSVGC